MWVLYCFILGKRFLYLTSMLHNLWIAKDTGECLFHKKYGSIDHDENLITSFLSAIEIFAQNVDVGCDLLQTKNYKFIYVTGTNTVTVACVDVNDDESDVRNDLISIQVEFHSRYANELIDWRGRIEHFSSMSSFVDDHLSKYSSDLSNIGNRRLELTPMIVKKQMKFKLSQQQEKVISLLKYKGTATLNDIVKLMKLTEPDAEKATRALLYHNVIQQVPSA